MQSVIPGIGLISAAALTLSCAFAPSETFYESRSPDGRRTVTLREQRRMGPDSSVRILAMDHRLGTERVLYSPKGDRVPSVSEVAWFPDSQKVGVLVCDKIADDIVFGFDFANSVILPPQTVVPAIRAELSRRYHVGSRELAGYGGDVLKWACDQFSDAETRFAAREGADAHKTRRQ
jgi:hypothetical protein